MYKTYQRFLLLLTIIALSTPITFNNVYAQPTVKIRIEPYIQKIDIGSETGEIKIEAGAKKSDLQFNWNLNGPGKLIGDKKSPAIFYIPPNSIDGQTAQATISVTVKNKEGEETTEHVIFTLIAPPPEFQVDDSVRIKESVEEPCGGWQGVKPGEIGIVTKINFRNKYLIVDFPSQEDWIACPDGMEKVQNAPDEFRVSDHVQIKESVSEPCGGWQGVKRGEIGTVTAINFRNKYLIVDFPSRSDLIICPEDVVKSP